MEHLKTTEYQMSVQAKSVVLEKDMAGRVKCEICLEECLMEKQKEHQEMCMARLMFRCTICEEDYVSKEGLWNHLDLHEIADESKELHYKEMSATFKLHQYAMRNDQRGYQEEHECVEGFQSHKLKTDHDLTHCMGREKNVTCDMAVDQKFSNLVLPIKIENTVSLVNCGATKENATVQWKSSQEELSSMMREDSVCFVINKVHEQKTLVPETINVNHMDSRLNEFSPDNWNIVDEIDNNMAEKESKKVLIASSKNKRKAKVDVEKIPEPLVDNPRDPPFDTNGSVSCAFCDLKFKKIAAANVHIRQVHHIEGDMRNIQGGFMSCKNQQEQKPDKQIYLKMEITVEETSLLQHDDSVILTPNSFTATEYPDFIQRSKDQKLEHSEPSSIDVSEQKSALTQNRKSDILKTFAGTSLDQGIVDSVLNVNLSAYPDGIDGDMGNIMIKKEPEVLAEGINFQQLVENPLNGSEAKCSHCGKEFSSTVKLASHIRFCHKAYPCNICGIMLPNYRQVQHHKMTAHTEPNHKCPYCLKIFYNTNCYQSHLAVCVNKKIPCELCGKKFKNLRNANYHKKRFHNTNKALKKAQTDQGDCSQEQETMNDEQSLVDCSRRRKDIQPIAGNASSTKCSQCGKEFVSVQSLSKHIHRSHKPITCNICKKLFLGSMSARYHKKTRHTEPKYKCANCPMKFHEKYIYQAHLPICDERRLPCKICGQMLKHVASLKSHMRRIHHIKGDLSEFRTDSMSHKQHQNQKQVVQIVIKDASGKSILADCPDLSQQAEDQITVNPKPSSVNNSGQRSALMQEIQCTHKEIDSPRAFTRPDREEEDSRQIEHSPANANSASNTYDVTEKKSKVHPITSMKSSSKTKACDICGITFSNYMEARHHSVTRHTEAEQTCPHCTKIFHSEGAYQAHLSCCGMKKFPCTLCDKKLKNPQCVMRHMRQVHKIKGKLKKALIDRIECNEEHEFGNVENICLEKEILTIDCPICGEHFGDQNQVSCHVDAIHQMAMCASCGMTFTSADQLNNHKLTCSQLLERVECQFSTEEISQPLGDTSSSGLSNTVCPHCDKDYCHKALLASHIAWCHQPVVCSICEAVVSCKSRMKYHKRKYHSEKTFKCPHCSKICNTKIKFLRHVSTHVKESMFPCKICSRKYKSALAVKDHLRRVHGLKEYQTDRSDCNELEQESQPCDSDNLLKGENMDLKMEIKVEETTLQEQEYRNPDEDYGKSPTITIISARQLKAQKQPKFSCNKCDQTFRQLRAFEVHVNGAHIRKQVFQCSVCQHGFKDQRTLQNHMQKYHTGAHMRTHKSSDSKQLTQSQTSIRYQYGDKSKVVDQGNKIKEEPPENETLIIPQSSTESSQFHETFSDPNVSEEANDQIEACSICGATFENWGRKKYHMQVSHTERTYKCSLCPSTFHFDYLLRRHKKVHSKINEQV